MDDKISVERVRREFNEFLASQAAKRSNSLFNREKFDLIKATLLEDHSGHRAEDGSEDGGDSKDDYEIKPRFRQYVKEKQFELKDFPQIGLNNAVIVPTKSKSMVPANSLFEGYRRVVTTDDIFDIIQSVHEKGTAHSGVRKTYSVISSNYEGITRTCVEEYCRLCLTCSCKKPQLTKAPLKPIISKRFHVRGQIDLIDMSSIPDSNNRWIGHYKDHFSKFSILWAQSRKCAAETVLCLQRYVFAYLGVPKILQSDHGREFNNELFEMIVHEWSQETILIRGRPRHPQSNGCVEKANGVVKHMLTSLMADMKTTEWIQFLPRLQSIISNHMRPLKHHHTKWCSV
ncbi:KRAB-A domain-containing protein 2-like [Dysidea avara]|uniref:KRAB-A domain-containing protein 2-like n=1 Tax=Dysidea avara TaxID=196820 RepID=UPI003324D59D